MYKQEDDIQVVIAQKKQLTDIINSLHVFMRQIHYKTEAIAPTQEALNHLVDAQLQLETIENIFSRDRN